jgi:hypothetical protein
MHLAAVGAGALTAAVRVTVFAASVAEWCAAVVCIVTLAAAGRADPTCCGEAPHHRVERSGFRCSSRSSRLHCKALLLLLWWILELLRDHLDTRVELLLP